MRLAVLDTPGEAQPVILAWHQTEAGKGVEEGLHALLDKRVGVLDQLLAVLGREHRQATAQQLLAQRRQIGLQVPLHFFKQPAGLPVFAQLLRDGHGLLAVGMAYQYQQLAVQRLLHTLFRLLLQGVRRVARHQLHQVGGQRRAMAPLPAG